MSLNKIYVGNLAYTITEEGLKDFFCDCGEITEVKIIMDHHSGRSKGFGFITFVDQEAVDKAVADKNGVKLEGRPLKVNVARERERRSGGGGRSGGGRGGFGGGGDSRRSWQ